MEKFKNEFILLEEENQTIYVTVFKRGFLLRHFLEILREFPTINITQDKNLQEALVLASNVRVEIGKSLPLICLSVSEDKMEASILLNCSQVDLEERRDFLVGEILKTVHDNKVTEGILVDSLQDGLLPQQEVIIARGLRPIDGEDAKIKYFSLSERKPTIRQDGTADYYDMNFIDEVKKGDWLGEKIPATNGTSGRTITGEMVVPIRGRDFKLLYDRKSVVEEEEDGKTVLRAMIDGVVTFEQGKISVGNHLRIDGDVGIETGNIIFDGSVTIRGIVQPGYSVAATKDISILGEMGLSGIKSITSQNGDIFIKGGIFGQGKSKVKAGKNIFLKHANDCHLTAKEDIHIGYYAIGSFLNARHILTEERQGKIIGGKLEAKGKIVAAIIGNSMERKTFIHIEGFNRVNLTEQLEEMLQEYKKELNVFETLKKRIDAFENSSRRKDEDSQLQMMQAEFDQRLASLSKLDENCKYVANLLEVKGEGEVTVKKVAYPGTILEIKNAGKRVTSTVMGTFCVTGSILQYE
ncbi:FapA family protein [Robertmurraya sp. Marseille-Q9965]